MSRSEGYQRERTTSWETRSCRQVRLPSGDRIQAELNDSHTVADLTKVNRSSGPFVR
jgi:hypothetical protein